MPYSMEREEGHREVDLDAGEIANRMTEMFGEHVLRVASDLSHKMWQQSIAFSGLRIASVHELQNQCKASQETIDAMFEKACESLVREKTKDD